jgi:hypothetical protein
MFNFLAKQTTADQDQLGVEPEKDGSRQYVRRSRLGRDIKFPFNAKDARQGGLFHLLTINFDARLRAVSPQAPQRRVFVKE